jgi:hypothetical protein
VSHKNFPEIKANFSKSVSLVSEGVIKISFVASISHSSIFSSIIMMVTPVVVSHAKSADWIGEAQRYFGRRDPCTLMHQSFGIVSTSFGKIFP